MLEVEEQLRRYGAALESELLREPHAPVVREPSRPRHRRVVFAFAALAAVAVAAVVLFGRSDEKSSQVVTRPLPHGVFAQRTGVVLLLSDGTDGVTAIDLDNRTAGRRVIDGERAGDQTFRITLTGGHVVVGWGEIYAQPLSGGASTKIDDATMYIPAAEPGQVWTITWEGGRIGQGSAAVRRVAVNGAVTFSSTAMNVEGDWPRLGVPGGLVVQTPEGVAVWDTATGEVGPTRGPGPVSSIKSNGRSVAWCGDTCANVHVAALPHTGSPTSRHAGGQQIALTNDGHLLAFLRPGAGNEYDLVVRDLTDGNESVVASGLAQYGAIEWDSDGRQLFYSENSYQQSAMRLGRYGVADRSWEEQEIPFGGAISGLVVLSPSEAGSFFSAKLESAAACPGAAGSYPSGRRGVCSFRF